MYSITVYFDHSEHLLPQVSEENYEKLLEAKRVGGMMRYVDIWRNIHVLDMSKSTHFVANPH